MTLFTTAYNKTSIIRKYLNVIENVSARGARDEACVCGSVFVCVCLHTCLDVCEGQSLPVTRLPRSFLYLSFLRQSLSLNPKLADSGRQAGQ